MIIETHHVASRLNDEPKRENIELFARGVEHGQVLEMRNATHYLIQSNQQEVLEAIEKFASTMTNRPGNPLAPRGARGRCPRRFIRVYSFALDDRKSPSTENGP